jgi:hypothetical protein
VSLYIELNINGDPIGQVEITRQHDDNGTALDAVNTYQWSYTRDGNTHATGEVQHRYGDGAVILANTVLTEIAKRHAAVLSLEPREG